MIILFTNLNTLDSMVGMVLTIFPLLCTLRTASVLTLYKNIYVNRYRAKFNKKSYRRDFHWIWFSSISYLFIIIVIMKVFLENTRRNPSSGMFNFFLLRTNLFQNPLRNIYNMGYMKIWCKNENIASPVSWLFRWSAVRKVNWTASLFGIVPKFLEVPRSSERWKDFH